MSNTEPLSPRALERRLKRRLLKEAARFMIVCTPGFEGVLAQEIRALPEVQDVTPATGGVEATGPLDTLYHANLRLRTASRVLLRIDDFLAQTYPMLFDHARKVPWELYLGHNTSYSIKVSARLSRLRHERNITSTLHEAILKAVTPLGLEPQVMTDATTEFHVRLYQDRCTISLNTSGEHLHKRGYRLATAKAPIRETLAAGALLACNAQHYDLILDPMCGAGTFLTEAALLKLGIPPGHNRSFAFEHHPYYQASKWERFKREATSTLEPVSTAIIGNDVNTGGVNAARANAERAGVLRHVTLFNQDALTLDYSALKRPRSLIISNLPYAERIGSSQGIKTLYQRFVRHLRQHARGWDYAFITSHPEWLNEAGLESTTKVEFTNGGLRVELVQGNLHD
jgi:putative N6-adenine-specific DNA methylase